MSETIHVEKSDIIKPKRIRNMLKKARNIAPED